MLCVRIVLAGACVMVADLSTEHLLNTELQQVAKEALAIWNWNGT